MKGEVKFYNRTKQFGFVKDVDSDDEYFVHSSVIEGDYVPRDGDIVEFEGGPAEKGLRATALRKAESSESADEAPVQAPSEEEDTLADLDDDPADAA